MSTAAIKNTNEMAGNKIKTWLEKQLTFTSEVLFTDNFSCYRSLIQN